jgi:hypothetical protein
MTYEYSPEFGLQKGALRPAGDMAVFEHLIDRLVDKVGRITIKHGSYHKNLDLTDKYSIEYPEKIMGLPFIALSLISERTVEPGIGRIMLDDDEEKPGFTKIMQLYVDIWCRTNVETILIADHISHCLNTSWKHFRGVGIRQLKHIQMQTRNYEQERSTIYQRMTAQTASRVWRKILQIEVEYDLVSVPPIEEEAGLIEQIIIEGDVSDDVGGEFEIVIGGVTELILDRKYVLKKQLKGVGLSW